MAHHLPNTVKYRATWLCRTAAALVLLSSVYGCASDRSVGFALLQTQLADGGQAQVALASSFTVTASEGPGDGLFDSTKASDRALALHSTAPAVVKPLSTGQFQAVGVGTATLQALSPDDGSVLGSVQVTVAAPESFGLIGYTGMEPNYYNVPLPAALTLTAGDPKFVDLEVVDSAKRRLLHNGVFVVRADTTDLARLPSGIYQWPTAAVGQHSLQVQQLGVTGSVVASHTHAVTIAP